MDLSSLTIKIIFILIPGLISYFIYKRITNRQTKRSDLMFIAISILLGTLSYLLLQSFCFFVNVYGYERLKTFELLASDTAIPYKEVFGASVFGIIIAYLFTFIDSYNVINNIAIKIRASKKVNDENLFSIFLGDKDISWVYIRDIRNSLTYKGWIYSFSENEESKEIVLREVTVYTYPETIKLYDLPSIYLNFGKENLIIEQAI